MERDDRCEHNLAVVDDELDVADDAIVPALALEHGVLTGRRFELPDVLAFADLVTFLLACIIRMRRHDAVVDRARFVLVHDILCNFLIRTRLNAHICVLVLAALAEHGREQVVRAVRFLASEVDADPVCQLACHVRGCVTWFDLVRGVLDARRHHIRVDRDDRGSRDDRFGNAAIEHHVEERQDVESVSKFDRISPVHLGNVRIAVECCRHAEHLAFVDHLPVDVEVRWRAEQDQALRSGYRDRIFVIALAEVIIDVLAVPVPIGDHAPLGFAVLVLRERDSLELVLHAIGELLELRI